MSVISVADLLNLLSLKWQTPCDVKSTDLPKLVKILDSGVVVSTSVDHLRQAENQLNMLLDSLPRVKDSLYGSFISIEMPCPAS
jgi:hypothetical protein